MPAEGGQVPASHNEGRITASPGESYPLVLHVMQCVGGGAPVQLANHLRATPEASHHVLWPATNDALLDGLRGIVTYAMPAGKAAQFRATHRLARTLNPDLVVAHSSYAGMYTRLIPVGAPVLYEPHGWVFRYPEWSSLQRWTFWVVERILASRTSCVVTATEADAATARRLGFDCVTIVPPTSRAISGATPHPVPTVVMAGRITAVKDPAFFADVARRVSTAMPRIRFVWVGGGDAELTRELTEAGVDVTGWVSEREVWDHTQAAHLYVHSSASEAFGLTLLDAAALGVPVIVRDIPAFSGLPGDRPTAASEMAEAVASFFLDDDGCPAETSRFIREFITDVGHHADAIRHLYGIDSSGSSCPPQSQEQS